MPEEDFIELVSGNVLDAELLLQFCRFMSTGHVAAKAALAMFTQAIVTVEVVGDVTVDAAFDAAFDDEND